MTVPTPPNQGGDEAGAGGPHGGQPTGQLQLFASPDRGASPNERYGPFPDGMHLVVWRTLALWTLGDWLRARGPSA